MSSGSCDWQNLALKIPTLGELLWLLHSHTIVPNLRFSSNQMDKHTTVQPYPQGSFHILHWEINIGWHAQKQCCKSGKKKCGYYYVKIPLPWQR